MCLLRGRSGVYNCRINLFLRLSQESKQASKQASQQGSKQASKKARRQASKEASKQARKQASERASKQAEKQASKQASKKAIKQSSKSSNVIKMSQNVTNISQKCHKKVTKMSSDLLPPISSKWLTFGPPFETSFSTELGGRIIFPDRSGRSPGTPSKKYYYMLSPGPCGCQ